MRTCKIYFPRFAVFINTEVGENISDYPAIAADYCSFLALLYCMFYLMPLIDQNKSVDLLFLFLFMKCYTSTNNELFGHKTNRVFIYTRIC